jgi:Spy/CpxP family protein refolding chaperone
MKFRMGAMAVLVAMVACQLASAQPGGGRGPGGGGIGGGGAGGLLRDDKVKAELNLVPDQERKLEALSESLRDKAREALRDINWREMTDADRAKLEEFRTSTQKEYDAILLPQQRERLKQLMLQQSTQFSRSPGGINETLAKELNITEAQMEALRKKAEEVRTELQKKTAKLQEEAKVEILSVLTAEQRSKLDKMLGSKFEFSPPQFGQGGPGGGGPGGQGGRGRGGNAPLQRPADGD